MKRMLEKIMEIESNALSQKAIWLPDLRLKMMDMSDAVFKNVLMDLVKARLVFLQKHAHPVQATDAERRLMVEHEGDLCCALAIRESEAERVRKILSEPERKIKKPVLSCESTVKDVPEKQHKGRGGAREGSGRHVFKLKYKRVQIGFVRLPGWIADWLKQEGNAGQKVEAALIAHYDLKAPD